MTALAILVLLVLFALMAIAAFAIGRWYEQTNPSSAVARSDPQRVARSASTRSGTTARTAWLRPRARGNRAR